MRYIVSLSGGVSSAVAAERVINRYGREAVTLWFADTNWEDPDLHRFMADCQARWGGEIVFYKDGRTPLQVAEDHHIIPNARLAPCVRALKIDPFIRYLGEVEKPVTVCLGLDWRETDRMDSPRQNYEVIEGVTVDYPLTWEPIEQGNYFDLVEKEWGIKTPQLYADGFTHNNCGGRCVKQGQQEFILLRHHYRERFNEVRDWEAAQRAAGNEHTILRRNINRKPVPLTLADLETQRIDSDGRPVRGDSFSCFCSY
jgi:hypothetical protein